MTAQINNKISDINYIDFNFTFLQKIPISSPTLPETQNGESLNLYKQADITRKFLEEKYPQHLSERLHTGIEVLHAEARKTPFLKELIKGGMSFCSKAYVVYLCNLYLIHQALENVQCNIIKKYGNEYFVFPELFRSERILNDIRIWSVFNTLASKFASKEMTREQFIERVHFFAEEATKNFVNHLEALSQTDPLLAIGCMYSFYGTILSGGQLVKSGVKKGFNCRIESHDAEEDGEKIPLLEEMRQHIQLDPNCCDRLAEESVSSFSFSKDFCTSQFKKEWHKNLDEVQTKLNLNEEYIEKIIKEANLSIMTVTTFIQSMLANLANNVY